MAARPVSAAGPKQNPETYSDYGGTPDLVLSGDVTLGEDELNEMLVQMDSDVLTERVSAAASIRKNAAGSEKLFRKALWKAGNVRHRELKDVLQRAAAATNDDGGLAVALLQMTPRTPAVNVCNRIVQLLMSLHAQDTMAGYKVLLDFSGRYAGAFRGFIGELMVHAGLKALPALIYGRGSENRELHMFSVAWIREMGDPLLSEQIQGIRNSRRLAQLLEAYASVNELDAIDVTLSLANHESAIVRNAARASLDVYGRNAKWSIHREFENTFGEEPGEGDFEQWVAALYKVWDEQRDSKTAALFQKGLDAREKRQFKTMDELYRELLSMQPLSPHRAKMADGYLAYAIELESSGAHDDAIAATRMARRLSEEGSATFRKASARLEWLHAESLRNHGALDVAAYDKLRQDKSADFDAERWAQLGRSNDSEKEIRWTSVIVVSALIFLGCLLLFWRVRLRAR
ncbi:MAG: hypothetical protein JXR76_26320 [Deltaproteobacteria bacterium]|nr:hypothetical protein [Deltaproteobacteria bacterium]